MCRIMSRPSALPSAALYSCSSSSSSSSGQEQRLPMAQDAPLGDHGTVVSGAEPVPDMSSSSSAVAPAAVDVQVVPRTPPEGVSTANATVVPGTALLIHHDKPAALGDDAPAATMGFNQDVTEMDDETKEQTKQHLLDMQKQIDALMNQLA